MTILPSAVLKSILTRAAFVSLVFLIAFCDESLPPHSDPNKVFQLTLKAEYVLLPAANDVVISMKFVNIFDETLVGRQGISGRVELTWERFSYVKKVINLNSTNLNFARNYNNLTGELIVAPGDSVILSCAWHVMADSEKVLRNQIFLLNPDNTCAEPGGYPARRFLAEPETFLITGDVRVFRDTAPLNLGSNEFTFCLVSAWIPVGSIYPKCLPPVTPCSIGPP